jgi:hypothetical protein
MWNVFAFGSTPVASSVYKGLTAAKDPILPQDQNGNFLPFANMTAFLSCVAGANVTAAQLNSPLNRLPTLPEIYPINASLTLGDPVPVCDWGMNGPNLAINDPLTCAVSTSSATAAFVGAVIMARNQYVKAPPGPYYLAPCTVASTTLIAGQWVNQTITLPSTLPPGTYTVVGAAMVCANALAFRIVFPGSTNIRPGGIVEPAYGDFQYKDRFLHGNCGVWGTFTQTAQPSVDIFGLVAGAQTPTLYLEFLKTG